MRNNNLFILFLQFSRPPHFEAKPRERRAKNQYVMIIPVLALKSVTQKPQHVIDLIVLFARRPCHIDASGKADGGPKDEGARR
jgi:hypothetical protein